MRTDLTLQQLRATVLSCLAEYYGLEGELERLGGENLNYLFTTTEDISYVFKIVDDDMPPEVVEMENEVIEHAISAGIRLKFPKIIQNKYGNIETGIKIHKNGLNRSRLLSYISGTNLEELFDISDLLLKNVGKTLASFDLAMENFNHPAARRNHRWNLAEAGMHRDTVELLGDPEQKALLGWAFDTWQWKAACHFPDLPWQFIHGDANRGNILVEGDEVVGLVDFGDSCINPAICELAICLAYIMMGQENPLRAAETVSEAYQRIRPLSELERSVLYPLVCGRLAVTISVAATRRQLDPAHPNWFESEQLAWELLPLLREII